MATLNIFRHRFYKNDGTLNVGGKVYTYVPGTSTLRNTYTDSTAGTPNTNPIILDSKGEASIWQTGKIKVNVLQSDDTQVTGFPVDDIGYLIIADDIHAATNKTTPVDADEVGIWDSIREVLNRVTFANLWVWIQSKLAAPGAIGGTTPAAGSFTTLTSTGGALNGTLGGITPAAVSGTTGTFTGAVSGTTGTFTGAVSGTAISASDGILSSSASSAIGYTTGAGGGVAQLTSKSTGVELNALCGYIDTHNASLAAGTIVSFTVTNTSVTDQDIVLTTVESAGMGNYTINTIAANGSFAVYLRNNTAGALTDALRIRFIVFNAVNT